MKILVTYFTQTGNTGKIAQAIHDEASKEHKVDLKKIEEINADSLNQYDLVFIGAPCQLRDLAAPVKKILDSLPKSPKYMLAGFYTHGSSSSDKQNYEKCITSFKKLSKEKQIDYLGCYDCQGCPSPPVQKIVYEYLKKTKNITDEEWEKLLEEGKKHPSPEDEQNAKIFARKVLSKI